MSVTSPVEEPARLRPVRVFGRFAHSDLWSVAALTMLPVLAFAVPALFGHTVLIGDDFNQNYPLRAFVGSQIRHGHLPLFDPYIWSGAPLLGGWNAGAAYPLTLLFVIMPATAAWTLNLCATWWVAGLGSYAFLRASRLSAVPSFVGAFSFAFAGAMTAQVVHFGLVAGMSWVPVILLCLLRLSEHSRTRQPRALLLWTAALGVSGAMVILAGEPRAITTAVIVVGIYALWRAVRVGRGAARFVPFAALGMLIAVCLGAVQWLPGLTAVNASQRSASSVYLFTSGSLPLKWLLLLLVPDLLGGSGTFGQPPFLAPYNLTEISGYVGLLPLVAAFALLGRLRWKRPLPEWIVWHIVAVVGILLTLGNSTPLWHLLIHVPLFGSQRLQSRNVLIADMGFAFLLAYWAQVWLDERRAGEVVPDLHAQGEGRGSRVSAVMSGIPGLLAVATVIAGFAWGAGLLHWLGATLRAASEDGGLRLWFLPFGFLGVASIILAALGRRVSARTRARGLVTFVVVDVVVYTAMTLIAIDPNLGHEVAEPGATSTTSSNPVVSSAPSPGGSVPTARTTVPASAYVGPGRFAVYDPDLLDAGGLNVIGAPDLNVVDAIPSVQGYSSIVDGTYASATGTHQPTGLGQDILAPDALANGTFDQLNTTVLFAPRDYFLVAPGDAAVPVPQAGRRDLVALSRATWYFGVNLLVKTILVPDEAAGSDLSSGLHFGLETQDGRIVETPSVSVAGPATLRVQLRTPVEAIGLVGTAGNKPTYLGLPSITSADGTTYTADGQLEAAVVPPRWRFRAIDGSFGVFEDSLAVPALSLHPLAAPNGRPEGATIRLAQGSPFYPSAAYVSSLHGLEVIRSVAAIPGWRATWHPARGSSESLPVRKRGLVQAVDVPAGSGTLTWSYDPPGWTAGWVLFLCALAALLLLVAAALSFHRLSIPYVSRGRRRDE